MTLKWSQLWRLGILALLVLILGYFLTLGREPLNHALVQLREWGAIPFYIVFAITISVGVPPSPFLLAAGAIFDLSTNVLGLSLAYAFSLSVSFFYASRLFKRQLGNFMAQKTPLLAGVLQESPAAATLLVRLTPGFPYVLQNCLLVTIARSFTGFVFVSLPPLVLISVLFSLLGKNLVSGNYLLLFFFAFMFLGIMFVARYVVRRRAAKVTV